MSSEPIQLQDFLSNWNGEFPNFPLTATDLKQPHSVIGAVFQIFDRLGINKDAVLLPPPEQERDDHMPYYRDLLPVINIIRVMNHIISETLCAGAITISVMDFLQPSTASSQSLLLIKFNLMVFSEEWLRNIALNEEVLFNKKNEVKTLEDKENEFVKILNERAEGKGKRAERLDKLNIDLEQFAEDFKQEKEANDEKKQQLEAIVKGKHQDELLIEQKRSHRDTVLADVARKRALRVYDVEDIKDQAQQVVQNLQEAEVKCSALKATLSQKENSLKNLQMIKPNLDTAIDHLHEIMKLYENLSTYESGTLDEDYKDDELGDLSEEILMLEAQLTEVQTMRSEHYEKKQENQAKRQVQRTFKQSALREGEELNKKSRELSKKSAARTHEIKQLTATYEIDKAKLMSQLADIKNQFTNELDYFPLGQIFNYFSEFINEVNGKFQKQ